jgi:hypothetical protein
MRGYSHDLMEYNKLNNGILTPFIIKIYTIYLNITECLLQSSKYLINIILFNTYIRFIIFLIFMIIYYSTNFNILNHSK